MAIRTLRACRFVLLSMALLLCLASCRTFPSGPLITVASANTPEQLILGKLTRLMLEDAGFQVNDKSGLGSGWMVRQALEAHNIDICWEYTSNTWTLYLGHDRPIADPHDLYERVRNEDVLNQVTWMPPTPSQATMGLVVRRDWSDAQDIYSLSDLADYVTTSDPQVRLCTPEEYQVAATGIRGLERVYGMRFSQERTRLGTIVEGYQALSSGDCDCALGSLTDAAVIAGDIRFLDDDRSFFLVSSLCAAVRSPVLIDHPGIEDPLRRLSSSLSDRALTELKRQVVVENRDPQDVAKRFLKEQKLLRR